MFVNYEEGAENQAVCVAPTPAGTTCLWTFDKTESKRDQFCSLYCERLFDLSIMDGGLNGNS